ncbi:MAG: Fur family transcriptional regulator, peroxide stress response regulator [Epulopiscium sp.]|jgi:Fur family peroxide stress response transcriptional regulator|nr:Fur family transcriptional regulator, peroxide stress response regulator [Candidatus Epulonipiscium sp.]
MSKFLYYYYVKIIINKVVIPMKELAQRLKEKNLKVTPQRLAIFQMLSKTEEHPSAETIYKSLEATHPTMSLATVYKTLDALKKVNLIQELNVGEDCFRYDANTNSHPHLICVSCREVFDMGSIDLDHIRSNIEKETNFKLVDERLYFYGICPKCQNK